MKKKILSLVLVVAMLASMLVFAPVSGATEAKATVRTTNATAKVGETVSVDVMLTTEAVETMSLIFEYDASRLEFLGVQDSAKFTGISRELDKNSEYQQWVAEGPYHTLRYVSLSGVMDCSTETHFATLNFRVKTDAAIGDAFVAFRHLEGVVEGVEGTYYAAKIVYNEGGVTNVVQTAGEIEYITSAITVLPEGYTSLEPTDASKFAFVEDKIDEYTGTWGGTIVIPDSATSIGNKAFAGANANTTVIVPASVTYLEDGAFRRPAAGVTLTVIFLGDILGYEEIDETPFATRNSNGPIVVKSAPGSMVATLIEDEEPSNVTWEAPSDISLTVEGVGSFFVSAATKAPGVMAIGDETVIGWESNDGKTYGAGETMALTGATELEPVTIKTPKMNTGIQFQMGASIKDCKMRYTTDMTIADYNTLASLGTVTLGTIITPAKYVSMAGGLTKEALTHLAIDNAAKLGALPDGKTGAGLTYIDVPASAANPYKETTDTYTFAGSLAGFKNENVNTKNVVYAAAFYATVELADGSSFTIYSNFDFGANRSVGDAITAMTGAGVEGQLTNTEAATLKSWIADN